MTFITIKQGELVQHEQELVVLLTLGKHTRWKRPEEVRRTFGEHVLAETWEIETE